jgi:hypothetical protein
LGGKGERGLQSPRCPKLRMPDSLHTFATRSWASPGGATLYNKAPPVSPELEKKIVHGLLSDLNRIFDLGLDTEPDLTCCKEVNGSCKPKILTIGGSHAGRISDEFEERGYTVLKVCKPGWRANKHPVSEIVPQVEELLKQLSEDDIIIIECLDNTAYFSRTEEGGDIPVRKYVNGEYHVEGDLVLATRERQALMLDKVVDPSPALPLVDSDGVAVWGNDPVHPLEHGYRLLVDLYIEEICNLQAKGGKRPGGSLQPPKKKMRTETRRQEWVENPSGTAVRQDSRGGRGGRGGCGGRGGPRGRGERGRGYRGGYTKRGGAAPFH